MTERALSQLQVAENGPLRKIYDWHFTTKYRAVKFVKPCRPRRNFWRTTAWCYWNWVRFTSWTF